MEEVPRKVPTRGIVVWWSEERDRRKGAPTGRAHELRSAMDLGRRKREMTSGSHTHPDKYLGDAWRTVRRPLADCPRDRCYNAAASPPAGERRAVRRGQEGENGLE